MTDTPILPDDEPVLFPSMPTMRGATGPRRTRPEPGCDLLGRYTVLEELGQGAMGVVYKCLDREGGIEVAIKCLPPEVTRDRDELDEIRENYQIVAKLHHSAISGLRNLERDPASGDYYVVMDLAEGEDLSRILRRRRGAPMPLSEALDILRPIAAALDYAHGEGVLHRDVKPANVKVRPSAVPGDPPRVQLLDFGLAAQVSSSMSRVSMRGHVGTSGTPAYMAPEQWDARRQTGATDQYALGVMAYEMLSGAPPFAADDIDLLSVAVRSRDPDPVEGQPEAVNAALLRALAKAPKERFPSCAAFVAALGGGAEIVSHAGNAESTEAGGASRPGEPQSQAALEAKRLRAAREEEDRRNQERLNKQIGWGMGAAVLAVVAGIFIWGASQDSTTPSRPVVPPPTQPAPPSRPVVPSTTQPAAQPATQPSTNVRAKELKVVSLPGGRSMRFRGCPDGSFTMGSPPTEEGRYDDETQHRVTLSKGFWMGETEVTQGQWKSLMDGETVIDLARKALHDDTKYTFSDGSVKTLHDFWGVSRDSDPANRCADPDDLAPVYYVSWNEATEFCRRLTEQERKNGRLPTGYEYRLPTEAQWEYACRAKTTTALPNGTDIRIMGENNAPNLDDIAWYGGNSSVGFEGRGWDTAGWKEKQYPGGRAAPRHVGTKDANDWGLYDMIGNVWEWCADWYGAYPSGAVTDPKGPSSGADRVNRGGSWSSGARSCRSARRDGDDPGRRNGSLGFRVALVPVQ